MDESSFGGLEKSRHAPRRGRVRTRGGVRGKAPVIGITEGASGEIRAEATCDTDGGTLREFSTAGFPPFHADRAPDRVAALSA